MSETDSASNLVPSPILNKIESFHTDKQWSYCGPPSLDNLPDSDQMLIIRTRKRQNREKASKFFGSELKLDISLGVIDKYRLPAMLESDLPLAYFLCYLLRNHGVENLFFWLSVQEFNGSVYENAEDRVAAAKAIFDQFICEGPLQVNTNAHILNQLQDQLNLAPNAVFKLAADEVYGLLKFHYTQFLKSEYNRLMISDLQGKEFPEAYQISHDSNSTTINYYGSVYPVKAYDSILSHIADALRPYGSLFEEGLVSKRMSRLCSRAINGLIRKFCNQRLLLEFDESRRLSMLSRITALEQPVPFE
jgi:hypothetical protein